MYPFKTTKELEERSRAEKFGLGAFNTNNLEITHAIAAAMKEENSPAIIAVSPSAMQYAGARYISSIARLAAEEGLEVALHLDHGTSLEHVMLAIRNGFSSVMIDASKLPFEENIALTNKVVEIARPLGISVEAELGKIFGAEDQVVITEREASFTDPEQAKGFVEKTQVDSLAVSIGNAHGFYKGKPELDFERLKEIRSSIEDKALLVLHGASGIPDEDIRQAIDIGITKINIDTEIRDAFRRGVTEFIQENPQQIDPRKILKPAIKEMSEVVKRKIRLFGSSGKVQT